MHRVRRWSCVLLATAASGCATQSLDIRKVSSLQSSPEVVKAVDGVHAYYTANDEQPLSGVYCTSEAADHVDVVRVGNVGKRPSTLKYFSPLTLITWPFIGIAEAFRWTVLEDSDSFFTPTIYDTFVAFDSGAAQAPAAQAPAAQAGAAQAGAAQAAPAPHPVADDAFDANTEFEIVVRLVAIDNFIEGRLRDSLGGEGGDMSFQVSLNALSDEGRLMSQDTPFLIEQERKRRFPLLSLLKSTQKGRAVVGKIEDAYRKAVEAVDALATTNLDASLRSALAGVAQASWPKAVSDFFEKRRQQAESELEKLVGKDSDLTGSLPAMLLDPIEKALLERSQEVFGVNPSLTVDQLIADVIAKADAVRTSVVDAAGDLLRTQSVGIDEEGLFEKVRVIQGLADADHLTTINASSVRPSLYAGEGESGTAAIIFEGNEPSKVSTAAGSVDRIGEGVVFRGTLADLSELGEASGFSLSVLMLERDSDSVVKALEYVKQYADDKGLTLGVAGTQIDASILAEGLIEIAERISDDDVELKALDLRFAIELPAGAKPGQRVFALRPCTIVVTRNFDLDDFGSVAILQIRKPS